MVLKNLEEFIHDVLYQELKPTKKLLVMAARGAYEDLSGNEAVLLAESVLKAVTFCKIKSKSMKSGVKLPPAVVSTIQVLKKLGSSRLGGQLREGASKVIQGQPGESSASGLCLPELPCVRPAGAHESPKKPERAKTVEELCAVFGVSPPAPSAPDCLMDSPHEECVDIQSSPEHPDHTVQSHRSLPAASSWEPSPGFLQDAAATFNKILGEMEDEKKEKNIKKAGDNNELMTNNHPLVFMDASVLCLCKMSGGAKVFATMESGPEGFAVGTFPDGQRIASEMPNCMLGLKAKAKGKAKAKAKAKNPWKAMKVLAMKTMKKKEGEGANRQAMKTMKKMKTMEKNKGKPAETSSPANSASPGQPRFTIMHYKATGAYAVRILGGRQLFQVKSVSPAKAKEICETAKARLQTGSPFEDVKVWAKAEAKTPEAKLS